MTDDLPLDADNEVDAFQNLFAGDVYRDQQGREFEILDVNYTFDIVKVIYLDTEEDASIRFAAWLASPPTLVKEGEWPESNVVLGEPEPEDEPATDDTGWGDDDEDDEEARWQAVKSMASNVAELEYERVRAAGGDWEMASAARNRVRAEILTNYQVQRLARG